jgi:predicted dehydrogenase
MDKELNVILVIDVQMVVNVGIIGYGNQAKRLEKSFLSDDIIVKSKFHPRKILNGYNMKNLEDLFDNDCIFITSPNDTHFEYLKYLINNFSGYIFCEKPPVTHEHELIFLKNLPDQKKQKIFFNFNFRFSPLCSIVKKYLHSKIIGNPLHLNFISTHGLAFKKEYLSSWRSDGKNNLNNILNTTAIHYIDFLIFHLGIPILTSFLPCQISKFGTSNDTAHISLSFSNNVTASIFVSYATSYINEFSLFGTKGHLTIRENMIKIFYPRDSFSKEGNFISPPIVKEEQFDMNENYRTSLSSSLKYFINHVQSNTDIPLIHFHTSLHSNQAMFEISY